MYKKQLGFQKIICYLAVIAAAITFIYSLGVITEIHDGLKEACDLLEVPGTELYYEMQPFNKDFVVYSIYAILAACFLFVMNTHSRRKYYIGNYVAIGIYSAVTVYIAVWSHQQISVFKDAYLNGIDRETLQFFFDLFKKEMVTSTTMLDLHYYVGGIAILSVVLLLANMIFKIVLMHKEAKLIKAGEEAAV